MIGKEDLVDMLYDKSLLQDDEGIVLLPAFENSLIGITAVHPKIAIYDFFIALDIVMKTEPDMDFDEAISWLEGFVHLTSEKIDENPPKFIKRI